MPSERRTERGRLEEELPGRDGGADDGDDEKDEAAGDAAGWEAGHDGVAGDGGPVRVHGEGQCEPGHVDEAEGDADALPAEVAEARWAFVVGDGLFQVGFEDL